MFSPSTEDGSSIEKVFVFERWRFDFVLESLSEDFGVMKFGSEFIFTRSSSGGE